MIRKSQNKQNTKQNKSINYEKIFTFNFCRNAGGVQRAGGRVQLHLHLGKRRWH